MSNFDAVPAPACAVGESPFWHAREQAWYWVDIPGRAVWRYDPANGALRSWTTPQMVACIAPMASGGLIAGMETGLFHLALGAAQEALATPLAAPDGLGPGMRFNDGRCDRQGRFVAGTMMRDMSLGARTGCVYSYEKESGLKERLSGFITPNGLAFSPDGRTMYLSDSHPSVQMIWAFDYDTATGTPSRRRPFVDMNPLPGRPDGAAVDEDGCYWICGNDAGLIHRFTPEGKLDRSLAVPVKKPAMCAFGGAGLDTLFVTSIRPHGVDLSDQPLAGGLFALRPGVRGLAEPLFSPVPFRHS